MGVIVVGIDHSRAATAALGFALEEARYRRARLRVIHAVGGFESYPSLVIDVAAVNRAAEELLENAIGAVREGSEGIEIESRLVQGSAGATLVEASRDADLLVVGSRGHGGFAGLLLGSVSQQCAQHAQCPVVIVRGSEARTPT